MDVAMLIFPDVTIQDFIGPYEVLTRVAEFSVSVVSPQGGEIRTEKGLQIAGTLPLADIKKTDILFIPGGAGINKLLSNSEVLSKVTELGRSARYVTSVCTGALLLAATGLLTGYRATTHWRYLDLLPEFGVQTLSDRVVIDRNRITGGGVTAGLDFALVLVAELISEDRSREIALQLEYNPAPPFNSGHPSVALPQTVAKLNAQTQASHEQRKALMQAAKQKMSLEKD